MPFELSLSYPQWQGSGRHENLPRGAEATAAACARFAPQLRVPLATGGDETRHGVHRWEAVFAQFRSAQDILAKSRAKSVLTAGGDCAVDVAVIDHLKGVHPDLQVIWIDAHLDGNTPDTSPSGNFHGMPARTAELRAQARQIIEDRKVPRSGESEYRFTEGGAIRTLLLNEDLRKKLSSGVLVVARIDDRYELLPRPAADKVRERDAAMIVLDHGQQAGAEPAAATSEDDAYYAQFKVPDDLIW